MIEQQQLDTLSTNMYHALNQWDATHDGRRHSEHDRWAAYLQYRHAFTAWQQAKKGVK